MSPIVKLILIFITLLFTTPLAYGLCEDFEIDGTYEASVDLPRILFLLKYSPNDPPIEVEGSFELNYAFLDTGASGILLSAQTAEIMGIAKDPNAVFIDTGVGGDEFFDVSEPLYIGTTYYDSPTPYNPDEYQLFGPWRFQIKQDDGETPYDVLGIPVMAGNTVVFNPSREAITFFTAEIFPPNDPNIPQADFQVPLRFEKYINPLNPLNTPPLPILAYNPVIDNIIIEYNDISSTGSYLFDTGGTISIISVAQGVTLGLTDPNGDPIIPPTFSIPIGGIGGSVVLPGFVLDKLSVPTLSGFDLVYLNARVCVHDIGILDEDTGDFTILDGIFGDNFICASFNMATFDIVATPFDHVIFDTVNALLGFTVNPQFPLPNCYKTDINNDCIVNGEDLFFLTQNFLATDCNSSNDFCNGSDFDKSSNVDMTDYAILAGDWQIQQCQSRCGDNDNPWPQADLTRDCTVDLNDLAIMAEEWLNDCDWLNWNCRGSDFNLDNTTNFTDFATFGSQL